MDKKVTEQELQESLDYLNAFAKGEETKPIEKEEKKEPEKPADEEPDDELYQAHKKRLASYLDKAMMHKGCMEKIKKGEPLPDEAFDDLEDEEPKAPEKKEDVEKGQQTEELEKAKIDELVKAQVDAQVEEIVKAKVAVALEEQKTKSDEVIKGLQDEIEKLKDTPVRKTLIKGADAVTLKKALSGEKDEEGKQILSISLQKAKVSEALYNAYEAESDEMTKGILGEAVAEFESTGSYLSPEVVKIMDNKGYNFIK